MTLDFKPPQLRPYQEAMIQHVFDHDRCALFARMGAGKTVSVLTGLDRLSLTDRVYPALIVAPKRVAVSTWPDEIEKWAHLRHLRVRVITGTAKERLAAATSGNAEIYTIAYDNIVWLLEALKGRWYWPTVVADESTRLKGFRLRQGGKRARALAMIAHTRAERWVNLTGLPAPNGLQDLWGQQWYLDRGKALFPTFTAFRDMWFIEGRNGKLIPQRGSDEEIAQRLAPTCLTIDPRDHLDVKEPNIVEVKVKMSANDAHRYKRLKNDMLLHVDEVGVKAINGGVLSGKLRQFASGFLYRNDDGAEAGTWVDVHDGKLDALESIVEEQAGAPLLVGYYYKASMARIKKRFPRARVLDANPETIRSWNRGEIEILLAHYKSAGHGLNLADGGCDLALFDHDWNAEEREQLLERIGPTRQAQAGHDRAVTIYQITTEGTIDSVVLSRTAAKVGVNDALLDHLKD